MSHEYQSDIDAIGRIDAVPTILDVICRATGMGFAAVARVTEDRWIACQVLDTIDFNLLPGGELKVETTICNEVRQNRDPVVINHVAEDEAYCGHPTPAMYGFQSYISMPIIRRDGRFFGTLCAIDPRPARLTNPETIGMFKLFAELIAAHLDANEQIGAARLELEQERSLAELREQFIAVLGHDLRNPAASIVSGTALLLRSAGNDEVRNIASLMQASAMRMTSLIENLLDFARARLGDGLALKIEREKPLQPVLEQVVAELKTVAPERKIDTEFMLAEHVAVDHDRIAQLLSNLVGNALKHGDDDGTVKVGAVTADGIFDLWVSNTGTAIPEETLGNLFKPFSRGQMRPGEQGLGLGLYIASEIAQAHGATLDVSSCTVETRFTFRLPLSA